jgi:Caudovirus prohead serine protease
MFKMEADFSGYATKAGLKCSDGRTIMADAFKHQDTKTVPLVWQHGHNDPENVLGHALLENREDGVYCYGFFNDSQKAKHTHGLIAHKDITMMSIWANDLIERSGRVLHGAIREVSLVLSGANPGALIENVTIRHSGVEDDTVLDDEAIIYTGLSFEHATGTATAPPPATDTSGDTSGSTDSTASDGTMSDQTVQAIFDSMTEEQKNLIYYLVGEALSEAGVGDNVDNVGAAGSTDNSGTTDNAAQHSGTEDNAGNDSTQKGNEMDVKHNVFEGSDTGKGTPGPTISHDDMKGILTSAIRGGSLKAAIEDYGLAHGITNVDELFPEAHLVETPAFLSRRLEWVNTLLTGVSKSPFGRIKTVGADLTADEARAKGYIKGNQKAEEFFSVSKRVTTPTTIYKKQELDRDDVVDITDFDVVTWLKQEMRIMLDEELARAILIGDGRDIASPDKINEQNIRPVAKEGDVFATTVLAPAGDASALVDAIITSRSSYKGTGTPTMFCPESVISTFMLLKDTLGRRIYASLDEVASELRVSSVVPVEVMEGSGILAIIMNPSDYVVGASAGGQVNLFDDFDIDYNKQKYLIETRCSGALTKMKGAIIVNEGVVGP